MSLGELLEEMELRYPEKMTDLERRHPEALEAHEFQIECDSELTEDLIDDLKSLLRI